MDGSEESVTSAGSPFRICNVMGVLWPKAGSGRLEREGRLVGRGGAARPMQWSLPPRQPGPHLRLARSITGGSGHSGGHGRRGGGGGFGLVARRTRRQAQRGGQRNSQHMAERAQDAAGMGRGREQFPKFGIGGEPVLQLRAMARHLRPEPEHPAKPGRQPLELRRGEHAECRSAGCRRLGLRGKRPRAGRRGRTLIGVGRGPGRDQAASVKGRHHGEEPGGEAAHPLQRRSDQRQIRPGLRPPCRDGSAQPSQNQGEHLGEAGGENRRAPGSTEYIPT